MLEQYRTCPDQTTISQLITQDLQEFQEMVLRRNITMPEGLINLLMEYQGRWRAFLERVDYTIMDDVLLYCLISQHPDLAAYFRLEPPDYMDPDVD